MREGDSQFAEKARLRNALEEACYAAKDGLLEQKGAARRLAAEWLDTAARRTRTWTRHRTG